MKSKVQVVAIITGALAVLRCLFECSEQRDLLVSFINIAALLIVVYLITEQIRAGIIDNIKRLRVPKQIEEREIRTIKIKISLLVYVPFAIISFLYLFLLSSGIGNDLISIIALGLSLCDDHIVSIAVSLHRKKE